MDCIYQYWQKEEKERKKLKIKQRCFIYIKYDIFETKVIRNKSIIKINGNVFDMSVKIIDSE